MTQRPYRSHPYREVPYLLNSKPGPLFHAPLAFAHRGADPERENTMAAFERAVELGYRYLEIDVRTAADGTLVVFHDEMLDRVTDGSGPLSSKTWEELSRLRVIGSGRNGAAYETSAGELTDGNDRLFRREPRGDRDLAEPDEGAADGPAGETAGEPLVTFEDLLARWEDVHLNVDLKDAASVDEFARIVEKQGAHERVLAASFNDARRHRVRRKMSRKVSTSGGWVATGLMVLFGPLGLMGRLRSRLADIDCVQVPIKQGPVTIVSKRFIDRCHKAGLQVHVWVVDEPSEMHRLLDLGVDGLMTDDVEALAAVMEERSVWPQR